jgi:branched-chain amino acid transport system permease protein
MDLKLNRNTFIIISVLVLAITVVNVLLYYRPVEAEIETTRRYGGGGFSFELKKGYDFNFSKLSHFPLRYERGIFWRVIRDNETGSHSITVTWYDAQPMNVSQALERAYNHSDPWSVRYQISEVGKRTIHGITDSPERDTQPGEHVFYWANYTRTILDEKRVGYIGFWNCTNSGRIHTLMIDQSVQTLNTSELFNTWNQTINTMSCHWPGQTPRTEREVDLWIETEDLVNICMMVMLCIGFAFTYMMEGFPNFAHTSYAGIGAIASFYMMVEFGWNPYDTWPFSAMVGGVIAVILYLAIVRPIRSRGGYQEITLTITFIILAQTLQGLATIFSYWARWGMGHASGGFYLGYWDFRWMGVPGIAFVGTATWILLVIGLHYFLTKTSIGISLRATAENEDLAATIGINTFRAHCFSWFLSGALAALAGSVLAMSRGVGAQGPDGLVISVMTGSVLGGISNVYGAIIGGIFIALAEKVLGNVIFSLVGLALSLWEGLIPVIFLLLAMFLFPHGVLSRDSNNLQSLRRRLRDLQSRLSKRGSTPENT